MLASPALAIELVLLVLVFVLELGLARILAHVPLRRLLLLVHVVLVLMPTMLKRLALAVLAALAALAPRKRCYWCWRWVVVRQGQPHPPQNHDATSKLNKLTTLWNFMYTLAFIATRTCLLYPRHRLLNREPNLSNPSPPPHTQEPGWYESVKAIHRL